jgi:adenine C2-methylase RlmN of 23S rRNA A2503 and tRNA A37
MIQPNIPVYDVLKSNQDASVNFVRDMAVGKLEARFVQRTDEYFIVYLSAQSGCFKACRMCHLTATGQNKYQNTTESQFKSQADIVLKHFDESDAKAERVHFNFMARGEPMDNPLLTEQSSSVLQPLADRAIERGLGYRFLISTIMPDTMVDKDLVAMFPDAELYPEIFYSIYSVSADFRRRWLPRAMPPEQALEKLYRWQMATGKVPKIHFAFIEGENDSEHDVRTMCQAVIDSGLKVNFNIVRYNPFSEKYGKESEMDVIERNFSIMDSMLKPDFATIVPKVGQDVAASCGMFVR